MFSARDSFVRQRLIRQAYQAAEVRTAAGEAKGEATFRRHTEGAEELAAAALAVSSAMNEESWFWDFVQRQRGDEPGGEESTAAVDEIEVLLATVPSKLTKQLDERVHLLIELGMRCIDDPPLSNVCIYPSLAWEG